MNHRLGTKIIAAIKAERLTGKSERDIATALTRQGIKVSVGSVHNVVAGLHPSARTKAARRPATKARRPATKAKRASRRGAAPERVPELAEPPEDADIATLDRWIAEHELLATKAKKDGDLVSYAAVHRLLQKALESRRKFRPPPAPNVDVLPDMVRAGAEAVRKLHELVDRALGVETAAS